MSIPKLWQLILKTLLVTAKTLKISQVWKKDLEFFCPLALSCLYGATIELRGVDKANSTIYSKILMYAPSCFQGFLFFVLRLRLVVHRLTTSAWSLGYLQYTLRCETFSSRIAFSSNLTKRSDDTKYLSRSLGEKS